MPQKRQSTPLAPRMTVIKKPRKPVTNVRHDGRENKMTKLGKTGIHYSEDNIIGKGSTAIVYEGFYKVPTFKAAIKRVFSENAEISKNEIEIWLQVRDSAVRKENLNIVQLYHWTPFKEGRMLNFYFAMELATANLEQTLKQMFDNNENNWRAKALKYIQDAGDGLSWLHTKRVLHRDIKPENIFIFCVKGGDDIAKLGDFGISKKLSQLAQTGTVTMGKGTYYWMAPEAIEAEKKNKTLYITKALDIFSYGMTAHYALTCGQEHPFGQSDKFGTFVDINIMDKEIHPSRLKNNEYAADHALQWAMTHDYKFRPTIGQMLNHPIFFGAKKSLEFIVETAKCLDKKNDLKISLVTKEIDELYKKINPNFNWKTALCKNDHCDQSDCFHKLIFQRNSLITSTKEFSQCYIEHSVTSLLKLIRDKYVHHGDLVVELLSDEYFGHNDMNGDQVFCEEKYGDYFCNLFPELVIFLFVCIIKNKDIGKSMQAVKWKYGLREYLDNIPDVVKYD